MSSYFQIKYFLRFEQIHSKVKNENDYENDIYC